MSTDTMTKDELRTRLLELDSELTTEETQGMSRSAMINRISTIIEEKDHVAEKLTVVNEGQRIILPTGMEPRHRLARWYFKSTISHST